jgi:hypothetical protein
MTLTSAADALPANETARLRDVLRPYGLTSHQAALRLMQTLACRGLGDASLRTWARTIFSQVTFYDGPCNRACFAKGNVVEVGASQRSNMQCAHLVLRATLAWRLKASYRQPDSMVVSVQGNIEIDEAANIGAEVCNRLDQARRK